MLSAFNSHRLATAGTTSLELALVLGLFLTLLLGTTDIVRYIVTDQQLLGVIYAAERSIITQSALGTVDSTVPQSCAGVTNTNLAITNITPFLDPSQLILEVCRPPSYYYSSIIQAQITAKYPFTPLVPGLDMLISTTITESAIFNF